MTMPPAIEGTANVVCPYCERCASDSWELNRGEEGDFDHECGYCEKLMRVYRRVDVSYSTKPQEQP